MVNGLNILLDAACELGKPLEIHANAGCVMIDGVTKSGESYSLRPVYGEGSDVRSES